MGWYIHMEMNKLHLEEPTKLLLSEEVLAEAEPKSYKQRAGMDNIIKTRQTQHKSPNQEMPSLEDTQAKAEEPVEGNDPMATEEQRMEDEEIKKASEIQDMIDKYGYDEAINKAEAGIHNVRSEENPSKKMPNKELRNKIIDKFLADKNMLPISEMAASEKGKDLFHEIFAQLGCESERNNPFIPWLKGVRPSKLTDKQVYDLNNLYAHGRISVNDLVNPTNSPMYKKGLLDEKQPLYDLISLYKKYGSSLNEEVSPAGFVFFADEDKDTFRPYKEIDAEISDRLKLGSLSDRSGEKRSDKGVEATLKLDLPNELYNKYAKYKDAKGNISQANMPKETVAQFLKDFASTLNSK